MREDHIRSAVVFLKEPEVASAALAKKVEFLESKGLTKEEIAEALRQAASDGTTEPPAEASGSGSGGASTTSTTTPARIPPASSYPVSVPPRPSYMLDQPPPIPRRDWKDYFVMATISAGVMYGIYECTRRYVLPMIMPPSTPALEADKEAVEEEFRKTEQLLKQMQEDTEALKQQEEARSETFEAVMGDARKVITEFKQHVEDYRQASRLALSNIEVLRESIPRTLEQHSEAQARVVNELKGELESLKALISRRTPSTGSSLPRASDVPTSLPFPKKKEEKKQEPEPFVPDPQKNASRIPEWERSAVSQ